MAEQENRNAFEDYKELSDCLLHAAHFWKTDMYTWNKTLNEINIICQRLKSIESHLNSRRDELIRDTAIDASNKAGRIRELNKLQELYFNRG